jgi:antirestriction protein ArdC
MHCNLNSKRPYRGGNQMLLDLTAMVEGYTSPYWLTYKGAEKLGGNVKRGEKGTMVVFWKRIVKEEKQADGTKEKRSFGFWRYFTVFNVEQCEGLEDAIPAKEERVSFNPIEQAQAIVNGYSDAPFVRHGSDRAAYTPMVDSIEMPHPEAFDTPEHYYGTLYHEFVHSTGNPKRLNRKDYAVGGFGSDPYSKEELVAEIGAVFLNTEAQIDGITFDNSAAYIAGWRKRLSNDPKLILSAASQAFAAYEYILGIRYEKEDEE